MEITQCIYCRKPFQSYGSKLCLTCVALTDECFVKIRDFLDEYPNADMYTVSEATEVPVKMILHLLKEGRLLIGADNTGNILLTCESCKRPINTGRLCEQCRKEIVKSFQEKIGSASVAPPKKSLKARDKDKNAEKTEGLAKIDKIK